MASARCSGPSAGRTGAVSTVSSMARSRSAARSTLPEVVSGNESSTWMRAGTMAAGSRSAQYRRSSAGSGHAGDERDQFRTPAAVGGIDHTVADRVVRAEHRLDLADLHPLAADLHLAVRAAEEHELPVRLPHHQVARAVHPLARRTAERVGDEPARGERRVTEITPGHPGAADQQLTRGAGRHPAQLVVDHVGAVVDLGSPDRQRTAPPTGRHELRDVHAGLRGAVQVHERPMWILRRTGPAQHLVRVRCLRPGDQDPQTRQPIRGQQRQQRHRKGHPGRLVCLGEALQPNGISPVLIARQCHRTAVRQRHEQVVHRHVERQRGERQRDAVVPRGGGGAERGHERHDRPVRHHHALGPTGGTGGVEHVGGVVRAGGAPELRHRVVPVGVNDLATRHRVPSFRDYERDTGVGHHGAQSLGRQTRVQRNVGATGHQHTQQRDHQVRVATMVHAHAGLGTDTECGQVRGQRRGLREEFSVGVPAVPLTDGEGVRPASGLGQDEVHQRGVGDGHGRAGLPLHGRCGNHCGHGVTAPFGSRTCRRSSE